MLRLTPYSVYIMSNFTRTVFYIGVTNNLQTRVNQHKCGKTPGFTSTYKCHYLVFYEHFGDIRYAIAREKQLKNWHREWKINLIKQKNPDMIDLASNWYD